MIKEIPLRLKEIDYKILIGNCILSQLGNYLKSLDIGSDAIVITNKRIKKLHGKSLISGLKQKGFSIKVFDIPDSEKSKSVNVAFGLVEKIATYDVRKKPFIIAFGGGVVGDLAGFIAAIYKRGIPYIQVPTTLLAQIDSAIGGKTAIDLKAGKNLVGAFYQPQVVFSDVSILSSLPRRQLKNALAEAVKYGVIQDKKLFNYIAEHYKKFLSGDPEVLFYLVSICSKIKAQVVTRDEKETKGIRTILNFGHTIGHAIEAASNYSRYCHGEAISLGMRIAGDIATKLGSFKKEELLSIEQLLSQIGLPSKIEKVTYADIVRAMAHDKKFWSKKNRFVLPTRIGNVRIVENIPMSLIKKSIKAKM